MNSKLKGTLCGIGAAVCYGMNPLGALPLYADGINTDSVLFYRYAIAAVILGLFMLAGRKSFAVTKRKSESWAFWEYCSRFLPLRSSQVFISWMPESPARCCSSILSWSQ